MATRHARAPRIFAGRKQGTALPRTMGIDDNRCTYRSHAGTLVVRSQLAAKRLDLAFEAAKLAAHGADPRRLQHLHAERFGAQQKLRIEPISSECSAVCIWSAATRRHIADHGRRRVYPSDCTQFRTGRVAKCRSNAELIEQLKIARGDALATNFAARIPVLLDDDYAPSSLRKQYRSRCSGRARADHERIAVKLHAPPHPFERLAVPQRSNA